MAGQIDAELTLDQLRGAARDARSWHNAVIHRTFKAEQAMPENLLTDFPPLEYSPEDEPTQPMPLGEIPKNISTLDHEIAIIRAHHEHIAKGIELFWGHRDCVEYLQKLILNGGDGVRKNRSGFKHEVVEAILNLIALAPPPHEKPTAPRWPG